ncbi:reverse transcriptase domain-containing protein, partial [Tanacetum coccineum]
MKKLILAFVYAARRLQRYFQAHQIRVDKWAIELGEHDIEFKGHNSIKGQVLADFLVKTPFVEGKDKEIEKCEIPDEESKSKDTWQLYTNGASSSDGSGVGLMLVSPKGKEYTYALRFEFEITNNKAKCKALLAGLRIAVNMKVKDLSIFVDSQLVANQVNDLFEARQLVIKQYIDKTKEVLERCNSYSMEHFRCDQNKKSDALSKLASTTFSRLAKEVLVEVLPEKSITRKEDQYKLKASFRKYTKALAKCMRGHDQSNSLKEYSYSFSKDSVYSNPLPVNGQVKVINWDIVKGVERRRREDLDILEERREIASIRKAQYKQKLE